MIRREDFPMLSHRMNGKPLVYLDNAATAQKPAAVIDRMSAFLKNEYANIHRGVYTLSQHATSEVEAVRERCRRFLGAAETSEIIFTRGATEAINLVAAAYGRKFLKKDDQIIIGLTEHHSNLVPWQHLCGEKELTLRVIPVNDKGELLMDEFRKLLGPGTRLVAVGHVSNALGTVNPVEAIIREAHHAGAVVLVDGAQGVPHMPVNMRAMDCDFYCFSGHKVYGPTGIGVLYGKRKHLEAMDPYQFGGDMIENVTLEKTTYAKPPAKFEAGTPAIAEIVGLGAALDYLESVGWDQIRRREEDLLRYATERLSTIEGLRIIGTAKEKASLVSFVMEGVHPHDVGTVLDQAGVAIRAGHHCAKPTMDRFGVPATVRASFAFYNTRGEVDTFVSALGKVGEIFK